MLKLSPDFFFLKKEKGIMFTHIKNNLIYHVDDLEAQIVSAIIDEKSLEEFLPDLAEAEDYDEEELTIFTEKLITSLKELGILE